MTRDVTSVVKDFVQVRPVVGHGISGLAVTVHLPSDLSGCMALTPGSGRPVRVAEPDILRNTPSCPRCGAHCWWWDRQFIVRCGRCAPPSAAWRERVLRCAIEAVSMIPLSPGDDPPPDLVRGQIYQHLDHAIVEDDVAFLSALALCGAVENWRAA